MKKFLRCIVTMGMLLILTLILSTKVEAATVTLTDSKTVKKGDSVTVTAKVTAGSWNLTLSGAGKTEGLVGQTSTTSNATASKSITFVASEEGTYEINLTGDITDYDTEETVTVNKITKITVQKEETPKPDPDDGNEGEKDPPPPAKATMTKVQVGDKTYTKTGFTVKVANDVTSIKVVPTISNGESYTINGGTSNDVKLEEGTNTVIIKLASGNSYKIYVRREAKEDDTPNIIDEPTEEVKVGLKSLLIKGVAEDGEEIELSYAPEFFSEIYEYQMLLDETLSHITKLDIQAIGLQNDFIIDITGNEELKEGENTITITVKSQDGKTTVTYTIVVTKEAKAEEVLATVDVEPEVKKPLWNTTQKILITVFTSIIAIMGIVFAVIEYRYQKEHKGEKKERNREETLEEEPSFSDINIETQEKEEVSGDVPFATIGFENEVDKENVRKEEPKFQKIVDQSNEVEEELKKQTKKGKHF